MELKVLEQKKQRFVFELAGADHTLCNAIKTELLLDGDVKLATYAIKHPLIPMPKFIIETKGKDAMKALLDASSRLQKEYKGFAAVFEKL